MLPEWVGETPDTPVPKRVRIRVFERDRGQCQICTRHMFQLGKRSDRRCHPRPSPPPSREASRRVMTEEIAREMVAAWMIANSLATGHGDTLESLLAEATWQIQRLRNQSAAGAALRELIDEHPVYRNRPIGNEGSPARLAQQRAIAAEDRAIAVLAGRPAP